MAFFKRKRIQQRGGRGNMPDGVWMKCEQCQGTVYRSEVEERLMTCPDCGYHFRIGAHTRLEQVLDPGSFTETHAHLETEDPLGFEVGGETYRERIERAKTRSGLHDAILTGFGTLEGTRTAIGVMDTSFIMASMGSVLGEKLCRLFEDAIEARTPVVVFCASGGARMQEGILALMQMAKTADSVQRVNAAGLPYITVLTDPTTGGVFASFASLGDFVLAEPGAYIGFAGQRLIAGAMKVRLPEGFQRAEYQFENGFIDRIVPRAEMRGFLGRLLRYLDPAHALRATASAGLSGASQSP
ncbi:MAG: acetyl-CoA carboxylase, carboxyltransferase subunit beta [Candidatus Hydrogenedentota bacterium]